ncbi:MAG: rubredoxin reductase [Gammaproteobacteria bacterium]|nr:MAG: rubredoxin reductase [Gammaproteobacteria bacterium]
MSKWECIVCGLIYDEAEGWPDDGIPPGTRWEDVPEDWLCPDCGVGKEDFELLEESPLEETPHHHSPPSPSGDKPPVVIIGSGLAGYGVAKEFRKHDSDTPLLIITADDGASYSKPMLSTGFSRQLNARDLAQMDAGSIGTTFKAEVWTMTSVERIDTSAQTITTAGGAATVHYSKLVLALGSEVIKAPLSGDALEYVYSVNDLQDYSDFRQALTAGEVKKVAIIGAGLIGCEFSNDLLNGGFAVETVDALQNCLPTMLPEAAGKAVQTALQGKGARFHFGVLAERVDKRDGGGVVLSLNNGERIEADIVLSAIGVRARTALASAAGIATERGIVTDRFLKTSAENVYALGDCAEVAGHHLVYVAPLVAAARALGETLAGRPTEVTYPAMAVAIKTPACPVTVAMPARDAKGQWEVSGEGQDISARFVSPDGELLGFALTGQALAHKNEFLAQLPSLL